ncbi:hypothetical protein FRC00_003492 [Tulasnella sp. 408]|nr:hypothetical protein FRC00_003492 [Tulasnella sp. 408]
MSDYDVMFHIPYGPGIDAKRIAKIVYKTDLGLNSTFNPNNKDRILHRHPFFFGNMEEALGDCCKDCPLPETDEEREMFEKEQEQFITGRVSFMQEDPGRQSITGSFHPIDSGEWSEQAYLKPNATFYSYIAAHNRPACNEFLKRNAEAVNTRDHLGRTPLQFALLCSAGDICLDLIEQGARMTARMVDGRYSLHLAAQMDLPKVVKALLEKSEKNKAEKDAKEKAARDNKGKDKDVEMKDRDDEASLEAGTRDSSEDDWSSENDEDMDYEEAKKKVDPKGDPVESEEDPLEDPSNRPDILEVDELDWDQCLTPLGYAIISGSLISVQILVAAGADCKTPRKLGPSYQGTPTFYPLTLTALTPDEFVGAQIAEQLITVGGASCAAADSGTVTVFHRLVSFNKPHIVEVMLKVDPTANAASRFLYTGAWQSALHPIVSAFASGQRAMVAVLLAYAGTRAFVDLETYDRSIAANPNQSGYTSVQAGEEYWKTYTLQPLEASLASRNDLYRLVLSLEPESVKISVPRGVYNTPSNAAGLHRSMLDVLRSFLREVKFRSRVQLVPPQPQRYTPPQPWRSVLDLSDLEISEKKGWDKYVIGLEKRKKAILESKIKPNPPPGVFGLNAVMQGLTNEGQRAQAEKLIPYFEQAVDQLEKTGAQTWDAIYPALPSQWMTQFGSLDRDPDDPNPPPPPPAVPASQMRTRFAAFGRFRQGPSAATPQIDETNKPFKRYSLFQLGWGEGYPGTHLIPLYDELYEACWNGDNNKIKALCLPPDVDTPLPQSVAPDLLQITARVRYTDHAHFRGSGYTPLYVALRARKWDTARLILEIAQKQLMKEENEAEQKPTKQRGNIVTFNDSDDDADSDGDSCASDETEKRPAGYTNLVKRFNTVSVKVKPDQLLSFSGKWATESTSGPDASARDADPITLAALENDVEAFYQIADMMEGLAEPMSFPVRLLQAILAADSPEMLDAFIRRTGEGLSLPQPNVQESADDADPVQHHESDNNRRKIYLGLDVAGKKRKDLARREDPNAPDAYAAVTENQIPIVWSAASNQATAILEYLNSPRAIDAYKYYSGTNKTNHAKRLAEVLTNTDGFSQMVGFSASRSSDTLVLAAMRNPSKPDKILPTLKKLMELQPRLTADGVRSKTSPLHFLCNSNAPVEVFDWILANGADPFVRDERGWNILHLLFNSPNPNWTLIEHVLTKLPADVTRALMVRQSRMQRNTPFADAVKKANLRLVELLIRTVKDAVVPTLLLRDSTGATPLHSAILQGHSKIVSLLISIGYPDMLYLENAVGSTPMEIIRLQFLTLSLRGLVSPLAQPDGLNINGVGVLQLTASPGMHDRDEKEIKSLRRIIHGIQSSGALARKPELFKVLSDFADRSEQEFATWVAQKSKDELSPYQTIMNNGNDVCDVKATFDVFSRAVVEVYHRQLVSLRDVQNAALAAVNSAVSSFGI